MSAIRDAFRGQLLERLVQAWHTDGVGVLDVGEHYVQWAKYSTYLQVECVSNAFLDEDDRLGFVQRRLLAELGFSSPRGEVPNYFVVFEDESELPRAAELLVRVVEEVLDESAVERLVPSPGNVCFVVPVGKCMSFAVEAVARPMIAACVARRPTVVINYGETVDEVEDAANLVDWLEEMPAEAPAHLSHPLHEARSGAQRIRWAADLATACDRLRRRGVHVFVMSPLFLPYETALYRGVVAELADSVVAVADHHGIRLCGEELTDLFAVWNQRHILALYGDIDAIVPGADGTVRFTGDFGETVPYDVEMAKAAALWELHLDGTPPSPCGLPV